MIDWVYLFLTALGYCLYSIWTLFVFSYSIPCHFHQLIRRTLMQTVGSFSQQ